MQKKKAQEHAREIRLTPYDIQIQKILQARAEQQGFFNDFMAFNSEMIKSPIYNLGSSMFSIDTPYFNPIDSEKMQKDWEKDNSFLVDTMRGSLQIIESSFSGLWQRVFGEANSVFEQITSMIASKLTMAGIGGLLNYIPVVGPFLSAAISGRATGGDVNSDTPYWVGEKGPELFIPKSSGTIIPNNQLSGGNNNELVQAVQAMNMNLMRVAVSKSPDKTRIYGTIDGNDIYLSNKRKSKTVSRYNG